MNIKNENLSQLYHSCYGGCNSYFIEMLQVQQNNATRSIMKLPWMTPTESLLRQCNWFSVRQLKVYHSITLIHRVLITSKPDYIHRSLRFVARVTRTTDHLTLVDRRNFKTATACKSFIPRAINEWNKIPLEIREIKSQELFKQKLKDYIKTNISVK